ncbi:MAG: sigma-70 family RNA polymerase sigma factor [Thermoanaerobaculales bacterium]|nr:sigma-70 family RNA polymerase sigma factor [Thermoanaerobaculales bacterium]
MEIHEQYGPGNGRIDHAVIDDRLLVRRAQRGDRDAFEALYHAHCRRIYALCLRLAARPADAEDLSQETFVRAWRALGSFRAESSFATWIHRVAINTVLAHFRRKESRPDFDGDTLDNVTPFHAATGGGQSATAVDLERAIAGLPTGARTVFVLHDVEGYRHREISEMTGLAEGTSKAHLHRARRLLREKLR